MRENRLESGLRLNDIMCLDNVVEVVDGKVYDSYDQPIPEATYFSPSGTLSVDGDGWVAVDGYSGQDGYAGPIMHSSEVIAGGMEDFILANDGFYAAVPVEDEDSPSIEVDYIGWVLLTKPRN